MENLNYTKCRVDASTIIPVHQIRNEEIQLRTSLKFADRRQNAQNFIRKCCLHILILLFTCFNVFGKIRNGYERDILPMKESLNNLKMTLMENTGISAMKRRKVEQVIQTLVNHISYYELTESLLNQFKIIDPNLYSQIDTITDRLGRSVDVYVKFVPCDATRVKAWGTTYLNQLPNDKDAYLSEYGPFTVSVKIWIVANALLVLSHELGHVRYQVPNLASYLEFHKSHYRNMELTTYIGHHSNDPSGKSANHCADIFRKGYVNFLRSGNEKIQIPSVLLARIRKNLANRNLILSYSGRRQCPQGSVRTTLSPC